jgi:hypothetical protein
MSQPVRPIEMTMYAKQISQAMIHPVKPFEMTLYSFIMYHLKIANPD